MYIVKGRDSYVKRIKNNIHKLYGDRATAFAYQMINIQEVQADDHKNQTDMQASATKDVEQANNTQENNQPTISQNNDNTSSKDIGVDKVKQLALSKVNGKNTNIKNDDD